MAGSVNKVILVGNVGKDPEIRTIQDGSREVANFTLATSESWKDKMTGERRERTEWHRVVIFAPTLVNIAKQWISKGSKIYVEGSLQSRKWTDQDGNTRVTTEVVLQAYSGILILLDSRGGGSSAKADLNADSGPDSSSDSASSGYNDIIGSEGIEDDEIPF